MKTNIHVYEFFLFLIIMLLVTKTNGNYFEPVSIPKQMNFPFHFSFSDNKLCENNSALFARSLSNYTLWAYRMWDASAKISIGLTEGSKYQLGHFDECISIKQPFEAQYCLATIYIKIKLNGSIADPFSLEYKPYSSLFDKLYYTNDPNKVSRDKLYYGLCVPSSCTAKDLENELQLYFNKENSTTSFVEGYNIEIEDVDCSTETKWFNFDWADYTLCGITVFLLAITVICTVIDAKYISKNLNEHIKKKNSVKYLLCFSAKQNFKDLTNAENSNEALQIIYGLRVLMIFAIVTGHSYYNILGGSIFSMEYIEQKTRTFEFVLLYRSELVVDLFLIISGLLNTHSYLVRNEKNTVNPLRTALLRYTRFAPVFAFVSCFYATIFYKLGSGPIWNQIIGPERNYCIKNWWTNVLFLNNYINSNNICILQGWYLATDFQLSLLAIPLNMLIKRNTKASWMTLTSILTIFILIPFLLVYFNNLEPLLFVFNDFVLKVRKNQFFRLMYIPVHTRASTYIIGMIIGYIYFRLKDGKFKLSMLSSICILSIGSLITAACLFSGIIFYNPYTSYKPLEKALFAAFVRPGFVIGCGLILFVTSFGQIPYVKQFLSRKFWIPLAKLSFSVYVVHWAIQMAHTGLQRTPINMNLYYWVSQVVLEFTLSYGVALILFICLENPFSKLMKKILSSTSDK